MYFLMEPSFYGGRADVCMHESQETGKDEAKIWSVKAIGQTLFIAFSIFIENNYGRKKTRSENRLKRFSKPGLSSV